MADSVENPVDPEERAAIVFMEWLECGGTADATDAIIEARWKSLCARGLVPVKSVPRFYIKALRARFPGRWMEARRAWRQERLEALEDQAIATLEGVMNSEDLVQSRLASTNILGHIRQSSGGDADTGTAASLVDTITPNPNVDRHALRRKLVAVAGGESEGS